MAKYTKQTIEGVEYELRPVEVGKQNAGFVPTIILDPGSTPEDTALAVQTLLEAKIHGLDGAQFCRLAMNGIAIWLQAKVRRMADTTKVTDEEMIAEKNKLTADEIVKYAGRLGELDKEIESRIKARKSEGLTIDPKKVWTEVI